MHQAETIVLLFALVAALVVIARKLGLPYPIVLVISGLALSFVPRLPQIKLNPDIVFYFFLPLLLYPPALYTSWRDFRRNLRAILLLAIGLVLTTMLTVAWVTHTIVPAIPWAAAFALGIFFGFSPFLGFHTLLALIVAFVLNLNRVAVLLGVYANLPWFLAPYYAIATMAGAEITGQPLPLDLRSKFGALFALVPYWGDDVGLRESFLLAAVYITLASNLNIMIGYTGYINFGTGAFFAIGNAFNPGNTIQPGLEFPYYPMFGSFPFTGTPFQMGFEARIKI